MKKLFLVLALLILGSIWTQGAFARTYPACYAGYGSSDPLWNGTNGDKWTTDGWCQDGYGVLIPKTGITTSSTQPNSQGGIAYPVIVNSTLAGPTSSTYDVLLPQQTGSEILDTGGYNISYYGGLIGGYVGEGSHYVLPPAYPGEEYTVTSGTKSVITVDVMTPVLLSTYQTLDPAAFTSYTMTSADTILWAPGGTAMTLGQNIKSPGFAGDSVTLISPAQGVWVVKAMQGAVGNIATTDALWTVISTN